MDMNSFVVLQYSDGKVDVKGPITGDVDKKIANMYSAYLLQDKASMAPTVEIYKSYAITKEDFIKEMLSDDYRELGRGSNG